MDKTIPDDILFYIILPKLPAKSLTRFKAVAKSWLATIESPELLAQHLKNSRGANLFSAHNKKSSTEFFSAALTKADDDPFMHLLELPTNELFSVAQSGNGIFCLHALSNPAIVTLFNPTTRKKLSIPPLLLSKKSYYYFHFGFDPEIGETGAYKIVGIDCQYLASEGSTVDFKIFTLRGGGEGRNDWRGVSCVSPGTFDPGGPGVSVNGAIHWLADEMFVIAFDLHNEVFRTIQLPDGICNNLVDDNKDQKVPDDIYNDVDDNEAQKDVESNDLKNKLGIFEETWPCLIQSGGFLAVMSEYLDVDGDAYKIRLHTLKNYLEEEWVLEGSMKCPEICNLKLTVPSGSPQVGEVLLRNTFTGNIVFCDIKSQTTHGVCSYPEPHEILNTKGFELAEFQGCYPENIMSLPGI